jgi:hypothetical protein
MPSRKKMDAIALLKQDHRKVEDLFEQFEKKAGLDMEALGDRLMQRKQELMTEFGEGDNLPAPETRSFTVHVCNKASRSRRVSLPIDPGFLKFAPSTLAHFGHESVRRRTTSGRVTSLQRLRGLRCAAGAKSNWGVDTCGNCLWASSCLGPP